MKRATLILMVLALLLGGVGQARADTISYSIQDIGTFGNYTDGNTSDTFSGTGFLGLYGSNNEFGHLLGLEDGYSQTELEVNTGALAGATITSAYLSFSLLDGASGSTQVTATSFQVDGTLGFLSTTPTAIASSTYTVTGQSSNTLDVTSLVSQSVASGQAWFGLYLDAADYGYWTYTYSGFGDNADSAHVTLVVNYAATATPEPASLTLLGIGIAGMAGYTWRRRKLAAA